MSRSKKCRRVCFKPDSVYFAAGEGYSSVSISFDEIESIRLVDYEGMEQSVAAERIGVSRGTLQRILYSARYKIAEALTQGKNISISAGDVEIEETGCGGVGECGYCGCKDMRIGENIKYRGEKMLVAITYENEEVYQHFGHTPAFVVYDVDNGQVKSKKIVDTNGTGHGALAGFLSEGGINVLICGGIGGGAKQALESWGIKLLCGVSGKVDDIIKAFVSGNLDADSESNCNHHEHSADSSCKCGGHKQ